VNRLDDLLVKTSRTFALSIPELPEPTRSEVTVAYLLFRVADTLEDATSWSASQQLEALDDLAICLADESLDDAQELARRWTAEPPLEHAGYRELLAELPAVVQAWCALAPEARDLVRHHTTRTIESMAGFVRRGRPLALTDLADLRDYCYAVAGIVGEMLTELFLLNRPQLDPIAPELRESAARFGEALQLVNILKDSAGDAREERHYLPAGVARERVLALAREDLELAGRYVRALQEALAPRGLVAFTALPVLLARRTLDLIEAHGPGAKVDRAEVAQIVRALGDSLATGSPAVPPATPGLVP